jgi:uncharacterized membrane protein (UPF0136 family)
MNGPAQSGTTTKRVGLLRGVKYRLGNGVVLLCGVFVLLGALYFGLASCGGYAWHKQAFRGISVALYFAALLLPSSLLPSFKYRLAFAACLPLLYVVLEAALAAFYPGPPDSLSQYKKLFLEAMEYGPCR